MYGMEWLVNRMRIRYLESSPRVKSLDSDAIPDRRAIRLVSSRHLSSWVKHIYEDM